MKTAVAFNHAFVAVALAVWALIAPAMALPAQGLQTPPVANVVSSGKSGALVTVVDRADY